MVDTSERLQRATPGAGPRARASRSAADRVLATLRAEIVDGTLTPGTPLTEAQQAERLGVSRTPVREALARLVADGLVEERGPRTLLVSSIDPDDVVALFELRTTLDEQAARLAARRATHDDRAEFRTLAERFGTVTVESLRDDDASRHGYYALVAAFDAAIDAALGGRSTYLATAIASVRLHLARVRRLARDDDGRLLAAAAEHRAIADAIADGDPERAVAATRLHLHNALTSIQSHLTSHDRQETP
ncbi:MULTISPECIES: GntR family transcriptional regulator [Microcella]|uniref:GntR family transcriptional regulator n=1 Tax=Microcella TaxID=337004 RepID=UPI0015CF1CC3|nr:MULTISPECIES: GntR family transcriptional regulator [Microcella]QOD94125.1 GntR family transcriptional regulator [Chryseoglobus sp. 28M-23]